MRSKNQNEMRTTLYGVIPTYNKDYFESSEYLALCAKWVEFERALLHPSSYEECERYVKSQHRQEAQRQAAFDELQKAKQSLTEVSQTQVLTPYAAAQKIFFKFNEACSNLYNEAEKYAMGTPTSYPGAFSQGVTHAALDLVN